MLSVCCVCVGGGGRWISRKGAIESAGGYDEILDNFKNVN